MNERWISKEQLASHLIILLIMLIVESGESLELHSIGWAAPVELLLWEFVSLLVADTEGNIVVGLGATNPSPEQQLFEVSGAAFV